MELYRWTLIRYHHAYSHRGASTSTSKPLPRLIFAQSPLSPRPPTLEGPPDQRPSLFPRDFPEKHRNWHMSTRTNDNSVSRASGTPGTQTKLPTHADLMAGPSLGPVCNPSDARKSFPRSSTIALRSSASSSLQRRCPKSPQRLAMPSKWLHSSLRRTSLTPVPQSFPKP